MQCPRNPHHLAELRDTLKPVFGKHDVNLILRMLINMATANHPITIDTLEAVHPTIDFTPYYGLIQEQSELGWNQLHLGRYRLYRGTDANEDI
eukprot:scaffold95788_cov59-Attheya_sp.AAC.4